MTAGVWCEAQPRPPLHATQRGCGGGSSAGPWVLAFGHPGYLTVFQELGLNGTAAVRPLLFTQRSPGALLSIASTPHFSVWRWLLGAPTALSAALCAGWAPGESEGAAGPALARPGRPSPSLLKRLSGSFHFSRRQVPS